MTTVINLISWQQENYYIGSKTLSLKTVHTNLRSAIILDIEYGDILLILTYSTNT